MKNLLLIPGMLIVFQTQIYAANNNIIWEIGTSDNSFAEFALAPNEYAKYTYPGVHIVGMSDPKKDWPYVQPGPADVSWTGDSTQTFDVFFGLADVPSKNCRLVLDIADSHQNIPPKLRIQVNNTSWKHQVSKGSGKAVLGEVSNARENVIAIDLPADVLMKGDNTISIIAVSGSWLIWDSLRLEGPAGVTLVPVSPIKIFEIEPTVYFPKPDPGQPLRQRVEVTVFSVEKVQNVSVKTMISGQPSFIQKLGDIPLGKNVIPILVPDIDEPTQITFEFFKEGDTKPFDVKSMQWQPQKKWKVYYASFSHHDLGYADYYHMIRRDVRELGIERALEFCKQTDDWDTADQYKWVVETSEPVVGYIQSRSDQEIDELRRRIKEGRIELGAIHNAVNSDGLSYEAMARLLYTPNRYVVDLLDIPPSKTGLIDDVVGLTRSLPLYLKEADIPYFFHGRNGIEDQMRPASSNPFYYWIAPDGDQARMPLCTTQLYHSNDIGGYTGGQPSPTSDIDKDSIIIAAQIERVEDKLKGKSDSILYHYCWDFNPPFLAIAEKVKNWNQTYAYPKMISSTLSQYFQAIESQVKPEDIYVFDKDAPNTWIDQDYTDVAACAKARKLGYALPMVEKFSTLGMAIGCTDYPWKEIWESYNRLLMYHEHTNSGGEMQRAFVPPTLSDKSKGGLCYYESEKIMHEMLPEEGRQFAQAVEDETFAKIIKKIPTSADMTVAVFNALNWQRNDIVTVKLPKNTECSGVLDNVSGKHMQCQKLNDGSIQFLAENIPSLGYKTFSIISAQQHFVAAGVVATDSTLENKYYKIAFDSKTGGISSIHDKELDVELVDQQAKYTLNQYLYNFAQTEKDGDWYNPTKAKLKSQSGSVSASMTANVHARGANSIRQTVRIYADVKRIDFIVEIDKASNNRAFHEYMAQEKKESVFYTFPLNIPDFKIRHELAGAVVEPITDQAIGSNTDYYGIQHFSDISGNDYGVTLATIEAGLIEYGTPSQSVPATGRSNLEYPKKSHMNLYLMNNWFFTNIRFDQPGPKTFHWSIRSHEGDWRQGQASRFGWDVSHPLTAVVIEGKQRGSLPADAYSFVEVESEEGEVILTTIKPAEVNGSGYILRFNELIGKKATVQAKLNFIDEISQATETSLVEVDRLTKIDISDKNRIAFDIRPHGIKTIRILTGSSAPAIKSLKARSVSDMGIDLKWKVEGRKERVDHYNIYRHTSKDFQPALRYWVGQSADKSFSDRPKLNYGGWKDNRLMPETTYYYKVGAVDRGNNLGQVSSTVQATTLATGKKNEIPLKVAGLYAAHVSPNDPHDVVSLWFYTNVEPDVTHYRIYRGQQPSFKADKNSLLVELDSTEPIVHTLPHGFDTVTRQSREYNRQMYVDENVESGGTYYYKVCAVDNRGQIGPFSNEISITLENVIH